MVLRALWVSGLGLLPGGPGTGPRRAGQELCGCRALGARLWDADWDPPEAAPPPWPSCSPCKASESAAAAPGRSARGVWGRVPGGWRLAEGQAGGEGGGAQFSTSGAPQDWGLGRACILWESGHRSSLVTRETKPGRGAVRTACRGGMAGTRPGPETRTHRLKNLGWEGKSSPLWFPSPVSLDTAAFVCPEGIHRVPRAACFVSRAGAAGLSPPCRGRGAWRVLP